MRIRTKSTNEYLDLSAGVDVKGELSITLESGTELIIGQQDVFTIRQKGSSTKRIFSEQELVAGLDRIWVKPEMHIESSTTDFKYYFQQGQKQLLSMINHKFVPTQNGSSICICGNAYKHLLHAPYRDVEGQ